MTLPWTSSVIAEPAIGSTLPGGKTVSDEAPAVANTRRFVSSTRRSAVLSKGTRPRSSRMNAAKACSISSEDESALAQRFVASRMSARRPSSSRKSSASRSRAETDLRSLRIPSTSEPITAPRMAWIAIGKMTRSYSKPVGANGSSRSHSIRPSIAAEKTGIARPPTRPKRRAASTTGM